MGGERVPSPAGVLRGVQCPSGQEAFPHPVRDLLLLLQLSHPAAARPRAWDAPVLVLPSTGADGGHQPAATGAAAPRGRASTLVSDAGGNAQPQDFGFEARMRCKHFLEGRLENKREPCEGCWQQPWQRGISMSGAGAAGCSPVTGSWFERHRINCAFSNFTELEYNQAFILRVTVSVFTPK